MLFNILSFYRNSAKVNAPVKCNIKLMTNSTINIKNITLAIAAAPTEIPVNPNKPATIEIIRNSINSSNIIFSPPNIFNHY